MVCFLVIEMSKKILSDAAASDAAAAVIEKVLPPNSDLNLKFRANSIEYYVSKHLSHIETRSESGLMFFIASKEKFVSFPTNDVFEFRRRIVLSEDGKSITVSYRNPYEHDIDKPLKDEIMGLMRNQMKVPETVEDIALEQRLLRPNLPKWVNGGSSILVTSNEYQEMLSEISTSPDQSDEVSILF